MFEFRPANKKARMLYGVATNDASYQTSYTNAEGKTVKCPYYTKWLGMLTRVYDPKLKVIRPNYIGCSVHPAWLTFSNFRRWMEQQDWEGKHLDKDLLIPGNKEYGPNTCLFLTSALNNLLTLRGNARGDLPLGVSTLTVKGYKYYVAVCSFYGKQTRLGYFKTVAEASARYLTEKNNYIQQLADKESDPKVAAALRNTTIS